GYTSGTAGANYFVTIQGVKANSSAGGILKILTSDNVGNSFERLRRDNTGNVGIGTASPQARLDVFSSAQLGSTLGNFVLLSRFNSPAGSGGNVFNDNTWLYRDASGSNWLTAR